MFPESVRFFDTADGIQRLKREIEMLLEERNDQRVHLAAVIDDAFGTQPDMLHNELCDTLRRELSTLRESEAKALELLCVLNDSLVHADVSSDSRGQLDRIQRAIVNAREFIEDRVALAARKANQP